MLILASYLDRLMVLETHESSSRGEHWSTSRAATPLFSYKQQPAERSPLFKHVQQAGEDAGAAATGRCGLGPTIRSGAPGRPMIGAREGEVRAPVPVVAKINKFAA